MFALLIVAATLVMRATQSPIPAPVPRPSSPDAATITDDVTMHTQQLVRDLHEQSRHHRVRKDLVLRKASYAYFGTEITTVVDEKPIEPHHTNGSHHWDRWFFYTKDRRPWITWRTLATNCFMFSSFGMNMGLYYMGVEKGNVMMMLTGTHPSFNDDYSKDPRLFCVEYSEFNQSTMLRHVVSQKYISMGELKGLKTAHLVDKRNADHVRIDWVDLR